MFKDSTIISQFEKLFLILRKNNTIDLWSEQKKPQKYNFLNLNSD